MNPDGIDMTKGVSVHDIGNLEGLNNLNIIVFALNDIKARTQLYLSKNTNKNEFEDDRENSMRSTMKTC